MKQRTPATRTPLWLFTIITIAGCGCLVLGMPPVDACKLVDSGSVNAAVSAWFGMPLKLQASSVPGPRGGTCEFATDSPKHVDFTIFYAPRANATMYGFNRPTPQGMFAVSHLGDAALFRQSSDPNDRYKSEDLAILKGTAVIDLNITEDKGLPSIGKEKLAEFAAKLVPKM